MGQVITSGHQPGFHHPGILAKRLALDAAARDSGAEAVWLVADQDVDAPEVVRYPDLDAAGRLVARTWRLRPIRQGVPTCSRTWGRMTPPPVVSQDLPPSINRGLQAMHDALDGVPGDSVAERFRAAEAVLLRDLLQSEVRYVRASELLGREPGGSILQRVLEDPVRCARVWNHGLGLVPRSGRRLAIDEDDPGRTEVPVWLLGEGGIRRRAGAREVARAVSAGEAVLPRAFLMTAVLRAMTGGVMIHGTGGGRYEAVTDHWSDGFLGRTLPEIRVVSRDLRLPLEGFLTPLESDPDRDELRDLEHDPWDSGGAKQDWLDRIRSAPRRSPERRRLFLEMHESMHQGRQRIAGRLDRLRARRHEEQARVGEHRVARDRTWAWPLQERAALLDATGCRG
ncbi:MAG: hypothetical protein VXY94_03640 [Planctomycetota bacterium]|nr:hypothetical protein [Planctomycetota bacterium]